MLYPALVFLAAILPRLFLIGTPYWHTPDTVEYLNVAQNIVSGQGLVQSIKFHFFDTHPVTTSALFGRPIAVSVLIVPVLKFFPNPISVQIFGLFLTAVNSVLVYLFVKKFTSRPLACLTAVLFATNPDIFITNREIMSEPFFILFFLLTLIYLHTKHSFLPGLLLGIAYLIRFEGLILFCFLVLIHRSRRFLLGFLIAAVPFWVANWLITGQPFYSHTQFHLQVFNYSDGMWTGFGRTFPTALYFITHNFAFITSAVTSQFFTHLKQLWGLTLAGPLVFLPLIFWRKLNRFFTALLLFGLSTVIYYSLAWSAFFEPARHLQFVYLTILLSAAFLTAKLTVRRWVGFALLAVMLPIYTVFDVHRIIWAKTTETQSESRITHSLHPAVSWIIDHTDPSTVIASVNPWQVYFLTHRPSVILPTNLTPAALNAFVCAYNVKYLLIDTQIISASCSPTGK